MCSKGGLDYYNISGGRTGVRGGWKHGRMGGGWKLVTYDYNVSRDVCTCVYVCVCDLITPGFHAGHYHHQWINPRVRNNVCVCVCVWYVYVCMYVCVCARSYIMHSFTGYYITIKSLLDYHHHHNAIQVKFPFKPTGGELGRLKTGTSAGH